MRLEVEGPPGSPSAVSTSLNFIRKKYKLNDIVLGPLQIMPISQYSCLVRTGTYQNTTNEFYYLNAARPHYYYAANRKPSNLPPNERTIHVMTFKDMVKMMGPVFHALNLWAIICHYGMLKTLAFKRLKDLKAQKSIPSFKMT